MTPTAAAALRLEALAPGYLVRVRRAALRLSRRDVTGSDVIGALADVEDTAAFDLDVPTLSRWRSGRLVKVVVRKLIGWYLRYLTQQVAAFSAAVTRFGAVMIERTDEIEETTTALAADLERLRRRVEHLEAPPGPVRPGPGPRQDGGVGG